MTRPSIIPRILVALVVLSLPVLAFGDTPIWPLQVDGCATAGNLALVSVTNCGTSLVSAQVSVQAVVNDTPIWSRGLVVLAPGQTGVAMVSFPGPVQRVLSVGVQ